MPQVPEPETLVSYKDAMLAQLDQVPKHLQALVQASLKEPISVDLRPCRYPRPNDFYLPKRRRPRQLYWFKTSQPIPNDPHLHMSIAAYLSDHQLLWTSLLPYGYTRLSQPHVSMLVSLDHAMWFHTDFRVDEWMLYEMESPRACGSRGWTYGKVWTRQGQCALTCTQEGLLRIQWDPQKPLASTHWETEEENENQREQKNLNVSTKQRGLTVGNETVTSSSTTIPINSSKWIENHLKQTSKL
ncbi:hypothetical protein HMI56_002906 [Coelomomyces lativittatus]|nr:hypothetical protein HMI56_002906 [Coelomomyces lativittatus]